jgi:hypothetical protein
VKSGAEVEIAEYSDQWPLTSAVEAELIRRAFEPETVQVEHIGSTAVPGIRRVSKGAAIVRSTPNNVLQRTRGHRGRTERAECVRRVRNKHRAWPVS